MTAETIARRAFTLADQLFFAAASGDCNPIHVDPTAARRLIAGDVVVHGMHTLLWALDRHCASGGGAPAAITAAFHAPVLVDHDVALERSLDADGRIRLAVTRAGSALATFRLAAGGARVAASPQGGRPPAGQPRPLAWEDLADAAGCLPVAADAADLRNAFPAAAETMGPLPLAGLMALSTVVGMECPGLHSLFAGIDVGVDSAASEPSLTWRVSRHAKPPAPLTVAVEGGALRGSLTAFVRPAPARQADMAAVAALVAPGEFSGQRALVVGGSRGLGELTAKIVAAGGGIPTVTYHRGAADAARVAAEITAAGERCDVQPLDVAAPAEALATLANRGFTHLYYFASPRIGRPKAAGFDAGLFAEFAQTFVTAFAQLVDGLGGGLAVFYPSTVFVDELPKEHCEYVAAKAAGEALCAHYARNRADLHVVVRRLPRLPTDQNAALIRRPCSDPLPILIEAVRAMRRPSEE